jgi:hypothetical protein
LQCFSVATSQCVEFFNQIQEPCDLGFSIIWSHHALALCVLYSFLFRNIVSLFDLHSILVGETLTARQEYLYTFPVQPLKRKQTMMMYCLTSTVTWRARMTHDRVSS